MSPDVLPGATVIDRRVPVSWLNYSWHRLNRPSVEWLAGRSVDVAHSAHPLLMPARRAAQVVTVHDLHFLDHPERTRAEIRRDYPALAAEHARRADGVIAVSEHTAGEVERRLGVPADRISVCSPGAPDWPRRTSEPAEGVILFLGTLEPRKNLGTLLDAYERLLTAAGAATPPRLVLAGGAPPEAARLLERLDRPPLAGHVDLTGYVDPADRRGVYERAQVLVMPSHMEGFGIPALEAMTCGVPVIAANRGALPEVVGAAGRLFDPTDSADLAAALRAVLTDAGRRQRMREAGWARAADYDWISTAGRTRDAWSRAIEARRRRERPHG